MRTMMLQLSGFYYTPSEALNPNGGGWSWKSDLRLEVQGLRRLKYLSELAKVLAKDTHLVHTRTPRAPQTK